VMFHRLLVERSWATFGDRRRGLPDLMTSDTVQRLDSARTYAFPFDFPRYVNYQRKEKNVMLVLLFFNITRPGSNKLKITKI